MYRMVERLGDGFGQPVEVSKDEERVLGTFFP